MTDSTLAAQEKRAQEEILRGDIPAAIQIGRRILAAFPLYIGAYALLAQAMLAVGNLDQAEDLFQRVLGAHPEHIEACRGLADIARRRGDTPLAEAWERRAQELVWAEGRSQGALVNPGALTRAGLARMLLGKGFYLPSIRALQALLREEPLRYDLQVALIEALYRAGRYSEAAALCREILKSHPFCLKACLILGSLGLHTDWDAEARSWLERAQALDPENRMAQRLLGPLGPLPPRTVRLPWAGERVLSLDFPPEEDEDLPSDMPYDAHAF